jgi:DivIVA domain-containing protein
MPVDQTSLDRIRNATFPSSRRGYDKHEVEKFLSRLADWLETGAGDESRSDTVKRELERVGQRTGAILAQAEESAQQIRAEAEEEARGTVNTANMQAEEILSEAEKHASETIASAQAQARRIVEEGTQRREDTEAVIADLVRRRNNVLADTEDLSTKLTDAVAEHRQEPGADPFERPDELDPLSRDADEEPQADREGDEPPSEETAVVDAESEQEART